MLERFLRSAGSNSKYPSIELASWLKAIYLELCMTDNKYQEPEVTLTVGIVGRYKQNIM